MLTSFKERLKQMAADPKDPFNDIVRRRLDKARAPAASVKLRNLTLLLPDMLGRIHAWGGEARVPVELRRLTGDLLTYMYHGRDFIHDNQGLFGYVDDAYVVARVYEGFLEVLGPARGVSPSLKEVREMLCAAQDVLPGECAAMDDMIAEMRAGDRARFEALLSDA